MTDTKSEQSELEKAAEPFGDNQMCDEDTNPHYMATLGFYAGARWLLERARGAQIEGMTTPALGSLIALSTLERLCGEGKK